MINTFVTLIYFVLILGVIILVHEFGHFIWAKKFGVYVHEFALGMGPIIWSKKKGETVYSLRAIPIGGFYAMAGEDGEETDEKGKKIPKNRKFYAKPIWQRFLILFFGAGNNFILAFIVLLIVGLCGGAQVMDSKIAAVTKEYPAALAGIEAGDMILEVNGHKTPTIDDVQLYITLNEEGSNLDLKIKDSDGKVTDYSIKPIIVEEKGVESYRYGLEFKGEYDKGIVAAFKFTFQKFGAILRQMVIVLGNLFTGGISVNNLSGPVGIYSVVDDAKGYGFLTVFQLVSLLSINVGFLNLIPFPAFDGGRIFLLLVEKIKGKPLKAETENLINTVGFILIMILAIYITGNDLFKLIFKK